MKLPESRIVRLGLGVALIIGGLLGFLPVVGFWMLPLGLAVLSVDIPWVRRQRRKIAIWWGRRRQSSRNQESDL
ncbi:MAG: hypothetical protein MI806_28840 [Minwuiales bacterium]|nr:hypothetical protein [Minwuiales bacterium]